jgi:hypothetical protein
MESAATVLVGITAFAHVLFMVIELFPWKRPFCF